MSKVIFDNMWWKVSVEERTLTDWKKYPNVRIEDKRQYTITEIAVEDFEKFIEAYQK